MIIFIGSHRKCCNQIFKNIYERIDNQTILFLELEELAAMESTLESEIPPNILWETSEVVPEAGEGSQYFEQYTIPGPITLRRGDAVYVRAENGKNLIAQVRNPILIHSDPKLFKKRLTLFILLGNVVTTFYSIIFR
jgi:hypothetical protein